MEELLVAVRDHILTKGKVSMRQLRQTCEINTKRTKLSGLVIDDYTWPHVEEALRRRSHTFHLKDGKLGLTQAALAEGLGLAGLNFTPRDLEVAHCVYLKGDNGATYAALASELNVPACTVSHTVLNRLVKLGVARVHVLEDGPRVVHVKFQFCHSEFLQPAVVAVAQEVEARGMLTLPDTWSLVSTVIGHTVRQFEKDGIRKRLKDHHIAARDVGDGKGTMAFVKDDSPATRKPLVRFLDIPLDAQALSLVEAAGYDRAVLVRSLFYGDDVEHDNLIQTLRAHPSLKIARYQEGVQSRLYGLCMGHLQVPPRVATDALPSTLPYQFKDADTLGTHEVEFHTECSTLFLERKKLCVALLDAEPSGILPVEEMRARIIEDEGSRGQTRQVTMDRKSLMRILGSLVADGAMKLHTQSDVVMVVKASLDITSMDFTERVEQERLRRHRVRQSHSGKRSRASMELGSAASLSASRHRLSATAIRNRDLFTVGEPVVDPEISTLARYESRYYRTINGYITTPIHRARLLHYYLWHATSVKVQRQEYNLHSQTATTSSSQHTNQSARCLPQLFMSELCEEMPMGVYCRLVGYSHGTFPKEYGFMSLAEYALRRPDRALMHQHALYRIRMHIMHLFALHLVTLRWEHGQVLSVIVKEDAQPTESSRVFRFSLQTAVGVHLDNYWSEVFDAVAHKTPLRSNTEHGGLPMARSWFPSRNYITGNQYAALETVRRTTPLPSLDKCIELADRTRLNFVTIVSYFVNTDTFCTTLHRTSPTLLNGAALLYNKRNMSRRSKKRVREENERRRFRRHQSVVGRGVQRQRDVDDVDDNENVGAAVSGGAPSADAPSTRLHQRSTTLLPSEVKEFVKYVSTHLDHNMVLQNRDELMKKFKVRANMARHNAHYFEWAKMLQLERMRCQYRGMSAEEIEQRVDRVLDECMADEHTFTNSTLGDPSIVLPDTLAEMDRLLICFSEMERTENNSRREDNLRFLDSPRTLRLVVIILRILFSSAEAYDEAVAQQLLQPFSGEEVASVLHFLRQRYVVQRFHSGLSSEVPRINHHVLTETARRHLEARKYAKSLFVESSQAEQALMSHVSPVDGALTHDVASMDVMALVHGVLLSDSLKLTTICERDIAPLTTKPSQAVSSSHLKVCVTRAAPATGETARENNTVPRTDQSPSTEEPIDDIVDHVRRRLLTQPKGLTLADLRAEMDPHSNHTSLDADISVAVQCLLAAHEAVVHFQGRHERYFHVQNVDLGPERTPGSVVLDDPAQATRSTTTASAPPPPRYERNNPFVEVADGSPWNTSLIDSVRRAVVDYLCVHPGATFSMIATRCGMGLFDQDVQWILDMLEADGVVRKIMCDRVDERSWHPWMNQLASSFEPCYTVHIQPGMLALPH
eukprot:PhM_4_TR12844/c0_g1_i1/m.28737